MPAQVFVSYSHADSRALTRLRVHLRPFERQNTIDVWSDQRIRPGDKWREEIKESIQTCRVAILLVSADFLASDFIAKDELPPLLDAEKKRGLVVLPIVLSPCLFSEMPELSQFQSFTDPKKPLNTLTEPEQEQVWVDVAKRVREILTTPPPTTPKLPPTAAAPSMPDWLSDVEYGIDPPGAIKDYKVFHYQHIDVLGFMRSAETVLEKTGRASEYLEAIRERLLEGGWEGDGTIQALWFPPFVGAGIEDTYGLVAWHVKQENNGTSWIASPVDLPFPRLREQQ